jgi:O-antigen/teichoic acid export membrane protein
VTVGWPLASELLFDAIFATVDIRPLAGAMALWIVAVTVRELVAETFRGFHEIRRATLFSGLVTGAASLAAYVGMWQLDAPVDLAAVVWVATVVAVLVCGLSLWQLASLHPWAEHGDFRSFREVLSISAPLLVVGVSLLLTREAHLWVLASVETERETAVFGVLNRLLLLITMSQLLLNRVMMPTFAALHARKEKPRLERLLQLGAVMASVPALVIVAICLSFGAEVLRLLFGDYYGQHGHAALKIASVGHLINVMSGMAGSLLMMTGHERSVMRTTVVCGIASVFVTYVLVAHVRLGIEGAATGYALGVILTNVALWAIAWRKTGIWTHFTTRRLAEGIRLAAQELDRRRM